MLKKALVAAVMSSLLVFGCHKKNNERISTADLKKYSYNRQYLPDIKASGINPAGFSRTNYLKSSKALVKYIENGDIQVINEGHRITLILPTDKYFIFDTSKLNDLRYAPLAEIVNLINCFPNSTFYVAGFTDDVGSKAHKKRLSQERAQAIVAYLWANGIDERHINAEGYSDKYDIAQNQLIHGSALNRRVEIQWTVL